MKPTFVISFDVKTNRQVSTSFGSIIEMAAQLYNTEKMCVDEEFHSFILPINYEEKHQYITDAPFLTRVMPKFMHWIQHLQDKHGVQVTPDGQTGNCYIVTWFEAVLNALYFNLRAVNLTLPSMFDFAVDIHDMFKTTDPKVYVKTHDLEITIRHAMMEMDIKYKNDDYYGPVKYAKYNAIQIAELAGHMIATGRWTK